MPLHIIVGRSNANLLTITCRFPAVHRRELPLGATLLVLFTTLMRPRSRWFSSKDAWDACQLDGTRSPHLGGSNPKLNDGHQHHHHRRHTLLWTSGESPRSLRRPLQSTMRHEEDFQIPCRMIVWTRGRHPRAAPTLHRGSRATFRLTKKSNEFSISQLFSLSERIFVLPYRSLSTSAFNVSVSFLSQS